MQRRVKNNSIATVSNYIDQTILWLTVVALVTSPLFFSFFNFVAVFNEPKVVLLHLTALSIGILWLWQIVLNRINVMSSSDNELNWDLLDWAGRNPVRLDPVEAISVKE